MYSSGAIALYREQSADIQSQFVIEEVKQLRIPKVPDSTSPDSPLLTGIAFLPNGSFVTYDKDRSIGLLEEKRMGGGCACCSLF